MPKSPKVPSAITTHHIFQQSLQKNKIVELAGGRAWIEMDANKLNLTNNADVAKASKTPLHSSNHPWIMKAQKGLLEKFEKQMFGGRQVSELLEYPSKYPAAHAEMKAAAIKYLEDIRDLTGKAILNGDLQLTLKDPSLGSIPESKRSEFVNQKTSEIFNPNKFKLDDVSAQARASDLATFRADRDALVAAKIDPKWRTFDTPTKMIGYIQKSVENGLKLYNTVDAKSPEFVAYLKHLDTDGSLVKAMDSTEIAKKIPQGTWKALSVGAKFGIISLVIEAGVGINNANAAATVAERNKLLRDGAASLAISAAAMALGVSLLPEILITTAAYGVYSYATDAETRKEVNQFVSNAKGFLSQVTTKIFQGPPSQNYGVGTEFDFRSGGLSFPSDEGLTNDFPAIEGQYDPTLPLEVRVYATGLTSDFNTFSIEEAAVARWTEDLSEQKVRMIYAGSVPIAFVILESNPPPINGVVVSKGTVVLLVPTGVVFSDGRIGWSYVGSIPNLSITDSNLQVVGKELVDSVLEATRAQGFAPGFSQTVSQRNGTLQQETRIDGLGSTNLKIVETQQTVYNDEFEVTTNVESKVEIKRDTSSGKVETNTTRKIKSATEMTRPTKDGGTETVPAGTVLRTYELKKNSDGSTTYRVDGKIVPEAEALGSKYDAFSELARIEDGEEAIASSEFNGDKLHIIGSTPRDIAHSTEQDPPLNVVSVSEIDQYGSQIKGDKIVSVSSRLVASRLAKSYSSSGSSNIPSAVFKKDFEAGVKEQVRQIQVGGQIGGVFGSVLGKALAGNDRIGGLVLGGVLGSITTSIGQGIATGLAVNSVAQGFKTGLAELPSNLGNAAVGAISSLLTAELMKVIGLKGFAGDLANTVLGSVVGQIASNIVDGVDKVKDVFNLNPLAILNAVGSFIGSTLASKFVKFDTVGGQLGSAIGSALGTIAAAEFLKIGTIFGGPIGAAIGAFVGYIVGGLIGSLFGGVPRSGADALWNENEGKFVAGNVWSRSGGSKEAALGIASTVANSFNGILEATGGTLLEPEKIQAGNYGMQKQEMVYRPISTRDKKAITRSFSGKDGSNRLISFGVSQGLADTDFQIVGGDVYIKRALYNSPSRYMSADGTVELQSLFGDLSIARDWSFYRNNPGAVEAISEGLSGIERDVYLGGWVTTAARASELGLDKRAKSDWYGGYGLLLNEVGAIASSGSLYFEVDAASGNNSRVIRLGRHEFYDAVDVAGQTTIDADASNNIIDLRNGQIEDQRGFVVNGKLNDDIAAANADYTSVVQGNIEIAPNRARGSIGISIAANSANEKQEDFSVGLHDVPSLTLVGSDASVTIVSATDLPYLQVGRSFASEADGYAVFRVSLSRAAASDIGVSLSLAGTEATIGKDFGEGIEISANGIDGWRNSTSLNISKGSTEYFVRTAVYADNSDGTNGETQGVEQPEEFTLGAKVTSGAENLSNGNKLSTGTGTILDGSTNLPFVWVDNLIAHAGLASTLSVATSRSVRSATIAQISTKDRVRMGIQIAATVDAGDGDDVVYASNLGDNVFGGAGNDKLWGGRLDDWLLGGDGDDVLNAGSDGAGTLGGDGNYLNGGAGNDLLIGREGSDWLEGDDGTDTLEGGDGDDILSGGAGSGDVLRGGRGDDQYIFRKGDSADLVRDESGLTVEQVVSQAFAKQGSSISNQKAALAASGDLFEFGSGLNNWAGGGVQVSSEGVAAGGEDALVFGAGIGLDDIKILKSGDGKDLIIELWPDGVFAGDRMTLSDWFSSFNKVETLRFADGNEVRIADFDTFILGSDGTDTIIGTAGNDFVHAGAGNDLVYLLSGNDFGNGGLGDDTVSGDSGNDIVLGSDGNDTLIGGFGSDSVSGGRGNDRLSGDEGNDIVAGGAGNDEVIGGAGNDIFKYQRGDGRDTFIDAWSNEWELIWTSGPGFAAGYTLNPNGTISHVSAGVIYNGSDWVGRIRYDMEQGKLWRHAPANAAAVVADSGEDMIEFGLGIDINDIQFGSQNGGKDLVVGIEGANGSGAFASIMDQIILSEWGVAGNSAARGSIEKFVFFNTGAVNVSAMNLAGGTDDNDNVTGDSAKENWLTGGIGDDTVTGGALNDILNGNGGQDRLVGGNGSDVLLGGADNDILIGGWGGSRDGNVNAGDILVGGKGLDTASYETSTSGVVASLSGQTSSSGDALNDVYDSVENLIGSGFSDTLEGDEFENELSGGKGDDVLRGAGGDDTYIFRRGDGFDTIIDELVAAETVIVGADGKLLSPYVSSVQLNDRDGTNFQFEHIVTNTETGEIIYRKEFVGNFGYGLGYRGTISTPTTFDPAGWVKNEDNSARFVVSGSKVSFVTSYAGSGADTLLFEDTTGANGVAGEQSIALSDLSFAFDTEAGFANDLIISLNGSLKDKVRIKNFRTSKGLDAARAIENIQFSDGSSFSLAGLRFDPVSGALLGASSDTAAVPVNDMIVGNGPVLSGGFGNDTLLGGSGNNTLQGGEGDDFLVGGLGADTIQGGAGIDTVSYAGSDGLGGVKVDLGLTTAQAAIARSESSNDVLFDVERLVGSQFGDVLIGNNADNVLRGLRGNDVLGGGGGTVNTSTYGLGNDVLLGDDGDDTLRGGVQEDNLDGGTGNDVLEGGGDRDFLSGGDGNDILRGDGRTSGTTAVTEVDLDEIGAQLVVNGSFEDAGTTSDNLAQSFGLVTTDLPGWAFLDGRVAQLVNSTIGKAGLTGVFGVSLDDGIGNRTLSQDFKSFDAGDTVTVSYNFGVYSGNNSTGFEVLWNGVVVRTVATQTTAIASAPALSLVAKEGTNSLSFRAIGAVDGRGAVIDNVSLVRVGSADKLNGGAGNDRLLGGGGNDTLNGGDGDDSSAFGVTAGSGSGNLQTFAAGLYGGAGNDTLDGGFGNDTLDGGTGNDSYILQAGYGLETITIGGGQDDIIFNEIKHDSLWLRQVGQDLEITAIGLGTRAQVKDWFAPSLNESNKARRLVASDKSLARSEVQALVTIMAKISTSVPAKWPELADKSLTDALVARWQDNATYQDRAIILGTADNDTGSNSIVSDPVLIGAARYEGLAGNDTINATRLQNDVELVLNDIIVGGEGADTLYGGSGDDQFLFAGTRDIGYDIIDGGAGQDSLGVTAANTTIYLQSITNIERIVTNGFSGTLLSLVSGGNLNLSEVKSDGAISIIGSSGAENIIGTSGNDTISGAAGNDTLNGGAGDDTIRGGRGSDKLDGGLGVDTYDASDVAMAGRIVISSTAATTHVAGFDLDVLQGFENVIGGTRADTIVGSDVSNRLEGRGGEDNIDGAAGDDILVGGASGDILKGGLGLDTASYAGSIAGVTVSLATNTLNGRGAVGGDAAGDKLESIENLSGSNFNDSLTGDAGNNILTGEGGDDTIIGGAGTDTAVLSGKYSDYLIGKNTVTDKNTIDGNDGTDTLSGIEYLQFADARVSLGIDPNNGPRLGQPSMADQVWDDGAAKVFQIPGSAFYDLDLADGMIFEATLSDNSALPSWLKFNPTTRTFSGTPPVSAIGTVLEIKVTATDVPAAGQSVPLAVSDTFLLTIAQAVGSDLAASPGTPLAGTFRNEKMIGTSGNDVFLGSSGADRIDGRASTPPGGDRVDYSASKSGININLATGVGSGGDAEGDTLISIEEVTGTAFSDRIAGKDGGEKLYGLDGDDTLDGGGGDDLLVGGVGADTLIGGAGNDSLYARALSDGKLEDSVNGGLGVDTLYLTESSFGANISLLASSGNSTSIEHVIGTNFADVISGNEYANLLSGGLGNDTLRGGYGADVLHGDGGNDIVEGGEGNDSLYGDDGNDRLVGGQGADTFYGGAGNDTVDYRSSAGGITASLATNNASGSDASGDVYAAGSIENIDGSEFGDKLTGSTIANVLKGFGGDDVFIGGGGDDIFDGGTGVDKIVYTGAASGYKIDYAYKTITDINLADGDDGIDRFTSIEKLQFADKTINIVNQLPFVNAQISDLSRHDNAAFVFTLPANTFGDPDGDPTDRYKGLSFTATLSDGTPLPSWLTFDATSKAFGYLGKGATIGSTLAVRVLAHDGQATAFDDFEITFTQGPGAAITGTADGETIQGTFRAEAIYALDGDDVVLGSLGADTIDGGVGVDNVSYAASGAAVAVSLSGGRGSGGDAQGDVLTGVENLTGSAFADVLTGSIAANKIDGGLGNDTLYGDLGNDILLGGDGSDTLNGGEGDDTLRGDAGADTVDGGAGNDLIDLLVVGEDTVDGGLGTDTVRFGSVATSLAIDLDNAAHKFSNVENIVGGSAADTISGNASANRLEGGSGNDNLSGRAGADVLVGGLGDDVLEGGADGDVLDGGAGTDRIVYAASKAGVTVDLQLGSASGGDATGDSFIGGSIENVDGSAFVDVISGDAGANSLSGNAGNDTLDGRDGNDILFGGTGNDTLKGGADNDTLNGGNDNDKLVGGLGLDVLYGDLGNDSLFGDVGADQLFGGDGDDTLSGGSGADRIDGGTGSSDYASYKITDDGLENKIGLTVDLANTKNNTGDASGDLYFGIEGVIGSLGHDILRGSANRDSLFGDAGNDKLYGGLGNDYLSGGSGTNLLLGEEGDDTLVGGEFDDVLGGGAGIDTINASAGNDLIYAEVVGEDSINGGSGIDTVSFAASNSALYIDLTDAAHKLSSIENVIGGAGSDRIVGSASENRLEGGKGADTIIAGAGDDALFGGDGNDTLDGGAGADMFSGGGGFDTVSYANAAAGSKFTTAKIGGVSVGTTLVASAGTYTLDGVYVNLRTTAPLDGIRAKNSDAQGDTFLTPIDIEKVIGSANSDEIYGSDGASTVFGGRGNDVVYGGDGNDLLYGDAGDDLIFGQNGADVIYGGDGNDRLFGEGESDSLYGGSGNDILDAGDAGDLLFGDLGNDIMIGGLGDDQYWLTKSSGSDTIYNYSSTTTYDDVIQYSADVTKGDLWFSKVSGTKDLKVKILGTTSQVVIKDWFKTDVSNDFVNAGNQYVLRMFIAGQSTLTSVDSLTKLLSVMAKIEEPKTFESLAVTEQAAINKAWIPNTPPTITAEAGNPTRLNEDGTAVLYFTVNDNGQTPLSAININSSQSGAVQVLSVESVAGVGNEGRRKVTVGTKANASGTGSFTLVASDGVFDSSQLVVPLSVEAVADGIEIAPMRGITGNNGTPIALPLISFVLTDNDGSEVQDYVFVDGIPEGTTLSDGKNSFTATKTATSVDVKGWNLTSLSVTPVAGSSKDFTLTVRTRSRETGNSAVSAEVSSTIAVAVNAAPRAIILAASQFNENVVGLAKGGTVVGTLSTTDPDGPGSFTYSIVGGAQAAKFRIENNLIYLAAGQSLDFEAGPALLDIRVRDNGGLIYTQKGLAIQPKDVNEGPSTPTSSNSNVSFKENLTGDTGVRFGANDPEGDAIAYVFQSTGTATSGRYSIVNGNQLWVNTALNFESDQPETFAVVAVANGQTSGAFTQTVTVENVDEVPTFTSSSSASISENTGGGAVVKKLTANDPEGGKVKYTLIGAPSLFAISGGSLVTTAGASFNYEAVASYNFKIRATDETGLSTDQSFRVRITNVNEAPSTPTTNFVDVTFNENTTGDTGVRFASGDPDGDSVSFVFQATNTAVNGKYSIRNGNELWVSEALDFESDPRASLAIVAVANNQTSAPLIQNLTIGDVNEAPSNGSQTSISLAENARAGSVIASLSGSDPEGQTLKFSTIGAPSFVVVSGTKLILQRAALNFEAARSYNFKIRATDTGGLYTDVAFNLTVTDINEAPIFTSSAQATVLEGAAPDTVIANFTAVDPENQAVTYSLIDAPSFFGISGTNLRLLSSSLNYEGASSYSFTVRATDSQGLFSDQQFKVNVSDVNEAPSNIRDTDGSFGGFVYEGSGGYTGVRVQADDPEGTATLSYSITGGNYSGWFTIDSATGYIYASNAIDRESGYVTNGSIILNVTATDTAGLSVSRGDISIEVADINEGPTFASAATATISEAISGPQFIANIVTSDADADYAAFGEAGHVLQISSGDTSKFQLVSTANPNIKQLWTTAGTVLDYEAVTNYNLQFRVYDNWGADGWRDIYQNFTVYVDPVDEKPSAPNSAGEPWSYENNVLAHEFGGSVDPEGSDVYYEFAAGGNTAGLFAITNPSGFNATAILSFVAGVAPDFEAVRANPGAFGAVVYEANTAYIPLSVIAVDGNGVRSDPRTYYYYLSNLNDSAPDNPVVTAWGTTGFDENTGAGYVVAYLAAPTDPDGGLNALNYYLTSNPDGMFEIVGNEVRVISSRHFDYERLASGGASTALTIGVATTDGSYQSGVTSFQVQVNNSDDNLPIFASLSLKDEFKQDSLKSGVTENLLPIVTIGNAVAYDADGEALGYMVVGGSFASAFTIDADDGEIRASSGADYEALGGAANLGDDAALSGTLTVRAYQINNPGRYVDETITFNVLDAPEVRVVYDPGGGGSNGYGKMAGTFYEGFTEVTVYGNFTGYAWNFENRVFQDTNGNGVHDGYEVLALTRGAQSNNFYAYLATGFQWSGSPFGSTLIQSLPPLVFDLNKDGLTASNLRVDFDITGNGSKVRSGWISGGDAFLALDRNSDGRINNGSEISFIQDKPDAKTDLEGLSAYDSNQDGIFDSNDARFGEFLVWQDKDEDGVSDDGELKSLQDAGIASIVLTGTPVKPSDEGGVGVVATSTFTYTNGTQGLLGDVTLRWETIPTTGSKTPDKSKTALVNNLAIPLALDLDGNGLIDTATEVFSTGAAASAFDSNKDAQINASDERYFDLRLWNDGNKNGRAEQQELVGLSASSTPTINLSADAGAGTSGGSTNLDPRLKMSFQSKTYGSKTAKYLLEARDGSLFCVNRKGGDGGNPRAGAVGGAVTLSFKGREIGMLEAIVFDMDGNGTATDSRKWSEAMFDMNGDGKRDDTGWISKGDGLLVIDRNLDGLITSGAELSFFSEKTDAQNNLEALSALDGNNDGKIDAQDDRFEELRLWIDGNGNGVTDAGELKTLTEHQVAEISVSGASTNQRTKLGHNLALSKASFSRSDGTKSDLSNIAFAFDPNTIIEKVAASSAAPLAPKNASKNDELAASLAQFKDSTLLTKQLAALKASMDNNFDVPSVPETDKPTTGLAIGQPINLNELRIAQMAQDMAAFGQKSGDSYRARRDNVPSYGNDWLTVSRF